MNKDLMRDCLENLRKESETTIRVLYALMQYRNFLTNQEYVDKLNKNMNFWLIYDSSLRTNLFLGIRRLYENKVNSFNFQNFINECKKNIDKFSKNELKKRKIESGHNVQEWIGEYMDEVYEPTEKDFNNLSKIVRENSKKMKSIYINAASTVFAHAIHIDYSSIATVSEQLNFNEIENALKSIWHVYEQIWELYENGKKPIYEIGEYRHKTEVMDSVKRQLG